MRTTLIVAEMLTALINSYLAFAVKLRIWPWFLLIVHFLLIALASATLAWASTRRHPWVPKWVIILAAYSGLPNLSVSTSLVESAIRAVDAPTGPLNFILLLASSLCQAIAFVTAIRRVESRAPAA